jgi:rhamnose utilization protein RhaD (predicted bifunctional aldolase and dehydrogenase)
MDEFLLLCQRFGQLEDLVQAGGGNISMKLSDTHSVIKSSGYALSDVTREKGFTIFSHRDVHSDRPLTDCVVSGSAPSMETYFHVFLYKYVVHLHPTTLLPFLCSKDSEGCVPYLKPGPELAEGIRSTWKGEHVILLQNHGVIVTGDTLEDVFAMFVGMYEAYRLPQYISLPDFWKVQDDFANEYVYKVSLAETRAYLPVLRKYNIRTLTPDIALFLRNSVHIEGDHLFLHAPTKQKCLANLEVLRSYCEVVEQCDVALTELQVVKVVMCPTEKKRLAMQ